MGINSHSQSFHPVNSGIKSHSNSEWDWDFQHKSQVHSGIEPNHAYMVHQLSEFVCIELEDETEDFIILHPKSEQQLSEIFSELVNNSKYIDKMSYPFTQMEFEVRKHTLLNILEKQVIQCNRTPLSNNKILLLVSQG